MMYKVWYTLYYIRATLYALLYIISGLRHEQYFWKCYESDKHLRQIEWAEHVYKHSINGVYEEQYDIDTRTRTITRVK